MASLPQDGNGRTSSIHPFCKDLVVYFQDLESILVAIANLICMQYDVVIYTLHGLMCLPAHRKDSRGILILEGNAGAGSCWQQPEGVSVIRRMCQRVHQLGLLHVVFMLHIR